MSVFYFQGEWKPKQIDNPNYKGKWVHPEIDNPEYVEDKNLYRYTDIGAIGFDLWQVRTIFIIMQHYERYFAYKIFKIEYHIYV